MERYIKPLCEVTKIAVENCLLAGSPDDANNEEGYSENNTVIWHAPKRRTVWDEDEEEY